MSDYSNTSPYKYTDKDMQIISELAYITYTDDMLGLTFSEILNNEQSYERFTLQFMNGLENPEVGTDTEKTAIWKKEVLEQLKAGGKYSNWPDQIMSVEFEDGYTRIPDDALLLAKGLETVIIPDTVTEIGQGAFANCTSLKEVNIPDNVTAIGDKTFYNCEDIVATYRGETYTYDTIDQLYANINANSAE